MFADAVQENLPVVIFKHSGFTADIAAEMMEKVIQFDNRARTSKQEFPECPFPETFPKSFVHPGWMKEFDHFHVNDCKSVNGMLLY